MTPLTATASTPTDLLSLTDAAQLVSGRPSVSAIWRWCRRGVLARDGTRIRLEHRRIGGKIFTADAWLDAFTKALTDADTAYFAAKQTAADGATARTAGFDAPKRLRRPRRPTQAVNPDRQRQVDRSLDGEGI